MDLALYARVLLRHRLVVGLGLVLALVLAVFSYYRVDFNSVRPTLTPRKAEVWQSQANVFLTPVVPRRIGGETIFVPRLDDPARFTGLASLYARLAVSDQVQRRIDRERPPFGRFLASPAVETSSGLQSPLPIVSLFGRATSPGAAQRIVTRGLDAFVTYMADQQNAAGIPKSRRVQLRVLNAPQAAVLIEPRKKTLPIVVFLAMTIAAIALAFILENLSRARPPVEVPAGVQREGRPEPKPEPEPMPEPEPEPESEPEPVTAFRRWA